YGPLLEGIRLLGQVILVGYGAGQVLSGRLTPGQVVAAFFYWDLFMRPTITLGTFYNTLMMTLASSEKVFALLESEPEVQEGPAADDCPLVRLDSRQYPLGPARGQQRGGLRGGRRAGRSRAVLEPAGRVSDRRRRARGLGQPGPAATDLLHACAAGGPAHFFA